MQNYLGIQQYLTDNKQRKNIPSMKSKMFCQISSIKINY